MKPATPVITLLVGTALGVAVLIASTLQTPSAAPLSYGAPAPASSGTPVTLPRPASSVVVSLTPPPSSAAASTPAASASPTFSPPFSSIPTTAPAVSGTVPDDADYGAQVGGGEGAAVAVSVHKKKAVAYVCDGHHVGQWFSGTVKNGKLDLASQNGAHIIVSYRSEQAAGYIAAEGHHYTFSAPTLHGHSGLYESIAMVHGVKVKFGWIVLPDGYQVGSAIINPDSANPQVTAAPPLDPATGMAQDDGVVITATLISGVTGSGF
jgi:hypothetical protein